MNRWRLLSAAAMLAMMVGGCVVDAGHQATGDVGTEDVGTADQALEAGCTSGGPRDVAEQACGCMMGCGATCTLISSCGQYGCYSCDCDINKAVPTDCDMLLQ